jgi:DNA-binding beta-propeller fold protein YncE
MPVFRALALLAITLGSAVAGTFGTVVPHASALTDLVLDEKNNRLFVVNTGANTVEVYRTTSNPPSLQNTIKTDSEPLGIAFSPGRKALYVACYGAAALDIIDTSTSAFTLTSVHLPASPEAVAVGFNEQLLVSTIGTGTGQDVLVTVDPVAATWTLVAIAPPAPVAPVLSASNMAQASRAFLQASQDGKTIIGVHEQTTSRYVFVFDVASAKVLGSRNLAGLSSVLGVSPDGSRFISGNTVIETSSLLILAQQNAVNSPFVFPATANFAAPATQGGAIYATTPLGAVLITAYNILPTLSPTPAAKTAQLLFNAPDNLLEQ